MVKVCIDSERELKSSSIETIKNILETSEDVYGDLKKNFPKGFKEFDKIHHSLTFGDVKLIRQYIEIKGFNPKALEYTSEDDAVLNVDKEEADY